jgi:hypothetical protein
LIKSIILNENQSIMNLEDESFIQEGMSPTLGVLILACSKGDNYDNPQNRILISKNGDGLAFEYSGQAIVSVDADIDGKAYVLSEEGLAVEFNWKQPSSKLELQSSMKFIEHLEVKEKGPLRRIRILNRVPICVGSAGQVYRIHKEKWEDIPGIPSHFTLEDVCAQDSSDVAVAGSDGYASLFDGSKWHRFNLPTKSNLTCICALGAGQFAIAGFQSTILIGRGDKWKRVGPPDGEKIYWGIATHDGLVYTAHRGGIDVYDGNQLSPLRMPDSSRRIFSKLRVAKDGIWSCSGQSIGLISKGRWQDFNFRWPE